MCARAGGVGVPALSVEDGPGGCRRRVLWRPAAAVAVLAASVGREGHLLADVAQGRSHPAAQDHGGKTPPCPSFTDTIIYILFNL